MLLGREGKAKVKNIYTDVLYRYLDRLGSQSISFIVSIVLARILDPTMYGIIAIANVFIALSNVFTVSGIANSLIQKKDADKYDFDTAFIVNLAVTLLLYAILFLSAPWIAILYKQELLVNVIRVLMIVLPISSIKTVQQAYTERNKEFKKLIIPTIISCLTSGVIGIIMALYDFGIWALVAQTVSAMLINTILLIITIKWYPRFFFIWGRAKQLFSYGWKLLAADLIDVCYTQFIPVIIGLAYTTTELAYFNRGQTFPQIIVANINASLNSVLFSYMSSEQDDINQIKNMTRNSVRMCTYVIFPLMLGLGLISNNLILLLLTEKWVDAIPYMQIMCLYFAFTPISAAGLQGIKAIGRSDVFLKLEIIKRGFGLLVLFLTYKFGVTYIAYGMVVTSLFSIIINMIPQKKYFKYSYSEQILDICKNIWLLMPMGLLVYYIGTVTQYNFLNMMIQVLVGMTVYSLLSIIFRNDEFTLMKNYFNKIA